MEIIKNGMIEIIYDNAKRKLRARVVNSNLWVRFPNELRTEGAVYRVEELVPNRSSYIAKGTIQRLK